MAIIGFTGSPRNKGNTQILVSRVLNKAQDKGQLTKLFDLAKLNIKPCLGCDCCKNLGKCVIKDDMANLVEEIHKAEAIVIGSPVYMGQMSGQTKVFFDRLHVLLNHDYSSRLKDKKKLMLIFAQGEEDIKAYNPYFKATAKGFEFLGFKVKDIFVAPGLEKIAQVSQEKGLLDKLSNKADSFIVSR